MAKGKSKKGPSENRAIHNAAEHAADAVTEVLGSIYRIAKDGSPEHEVLFHMLQACERMRVVVDQMAALATGKTKGRIEALSAKAQERIGDTTAALINAGKLPPPPPDMFGS